MRRPRPSHFRITQSHVALSDEGDPRIALDLRYQGENITLGSSFAAFRLPDRSDATLTSLIKTLISAESEVTVALHEGRHRLPRARDRSLNIALANDTRCTISTAIVEPVPGKLPSDCVDGSAAQLKSLVIAFEPEIRLEELSGLVTLAARQVEQNRKSLQRLYHRLPAPLLSLFAAATTSADLAFSLDVSRLSLSLKPQTDTVSPAGNEILDVHLSGAVHVLDHLVFPFEHVLIPGSLLPDLPADLVALRDVVVREILGSHDRVNPSVEPNPPLPLFDSITKSIIRADGWVRACLDLPPVALHFHGRDGTDTSLEVQARDRIVVQGPIAVNRENEGDTTRLALNAPDLQLSGAFGTAHVGFQGHSLDCDDVSRDPKRHHRADRRSARGKSLRAEVTLEPQSRLPNLDLLFERSHPLCAGDTKTQLNLSKVSASGRLGIDISDQHLGITIANKIEMRAAIEPTSWLRFRRGETEGIGRLSGRIRGHCSQRPGRDVSVKCSVLAAVDHNVDGQLLPIAELGLADGKLKGRGSANIKAELRTHLHVDEANALVADFKGTGADILLKQTTFEVDQRRLAIPHETRVSTIVRQGGISADGFTPVTVGLKWNLHGKSIELLHEVVGEDKAVPLLAPSLREGALGLHIDENGTLSFSGERDGLYGVRFFNALLNPADDIAKWYNLLTSDDAFAYVRATLGVFSTPLALALEDLRLLLLTTREIGRREGIAKLGDLLPRAILARTLSLLLVGTPRLSAEFEPIFAEATHGRGLPKAATRRILEREFEEFGLTYEIIALVSWLDVLVHPGAGLDPLSGQEEAPLVEQRCHHTSLADIPSAAEIVKRVETQTIDASVNRIFVTIAAEMSLEQLDFIIHHHAAPSSAEDSGNTRGKLDSSALAHLDRMRQVKRRVRDISRDYGGVEHAAQAQSIALLLRDTASAYNQLHLGAADIAALLQAGLATGTQGRRTQLNNRILIETIREREPDFLLHVLIELGHQSPRALAGILYAFLEQDQDQLAETIDLAHFLSERLSMDVPRQREFLAGGRRARESYYSSLTALAERIIAASDPYLARKNHLQHIRHAPAPAITLPPSYQQLASAAEASIARADALGMRLQEAHDHNESVQDGAGDEAREAYELAFNNCRAVLEREVRAFQLPWLRTFWQRNEEALRVLSVVRAYQNDFDHVRRWLEISRAESPNPHRGQGAVQIGESAFARSEQELVESVICALYASANDQNTLLGDPLVRLLIEPRSARYDFTLISCMGVITEGVSGTELDATYSRLEVRRGIRVIRAATGTGRSLEYNAERIIEAMREASGPFGIVGYSQGCANALLAESLLRGGVPSEQRVLDGLVCRNFLYSAANGSLHGTAGNQRFSRAMVEGERLLKHYQAVYSWEAIRSVLRGFRAALDSPFFVSFLGGTYSLSYERARELHRDGQFLDTAPTSQVRAVVTESRLPEALEYAYFVLSELAGGAAQDSQVLLSDARVASTRVRNANTRAFARTEIQTMPQATHHWGPLDQEADIVKTQRDHTRAVYDSPKDQLIAPWVEVNARFGLIKEE